MSSIDDIIAYEYSGQSGSGSLPFFVGKQYGAGWLRSIARFAFPFLKTAVNSVGKIAANTAEDLLNNENKKFADTLKSNAVAEVRRVLKRPATTTTINKRKKKRARTNKVAF